MTPKFWTDFASTYTSGAGSAFIFHGNTADHVQPGVYLNSFLKQALVKRDVIVFYDRASGFSFPLPSMEEKARQILDMTGQAAPAPTGAMALLMGGGAQPSGPEPFPTDPAAAFGLIDKLLRTTKATTAVIVNHVETILPAAQLSFMPAGERTLLVQAMEWARPDAQPENPLILVTRSLADVNEALRSSTSGYKALELALPNRQQRNEFIAWYTEQMPVVFDGITPAELANQTAGLTLTHVESILLGARQSGSLTRDTARSLKDAMIEQEYAGLVEVLNPDYGFAEIGGMQRLKDWASENIISPVKQGRKGDVPKGVVLVGPPGTGKTFFITGLAREIGFNAVAISMDKILGGIVGESEKRMARVLALVRSITPVLIFMDEIDQSDVAQRGNGSGNPVASNLFNQLLRFLGDPAIRGEVIFFAATNRPDLLDSALIRNERTDAIIPVLLPNQEERRAIILAQAKRQVVEISAFVADASAGMTENYSAADLAALVRKAKAKARCDGRCDVHAPDMMAAVAALRPNTLKTARYYTLLALQAVNDTDLLPPEYAALREDEEALQTELENAAPQIRKGRSL